MATTTIKPSSYVAENNKVYMLIGAIILAAMLAYAYGSLMQANTTATEVMPVYDVYETTVDLN